MTTTVPTTICTTPPDSARGLIEDSGSLYESEPWLAIEQDVATHAPFYVQLDDQRGTTFAAAYHFDALSNPWPAARLDLFLRRLELTERPEPGVLPCYLLGGRRPGHSHLLDAARPGERVGLLADTIRAAAAEARQRGAATLAALYCDADDSELAEAFTACGGYGFASWADHELQLPGTGFDDWLAGLGRKQRGNERADIRKLAEGGVSYTVGPLEPSDVDWVVDLELGLYGKYGTDYQVGEARRLHLAYLSRLGDAAQLITAWRGGRRVGFASLIRHGDQAYVRQGGFDHDTCHDVPVYFGAVFHTAIRWAYSVGVRQLDYATSADAPKRHRGCRARERTAWIVPLTDAARDVVSRLQSSAGLPSRAG